MTAPLLVATDLDGTLLDSESYSWAPARDAVAALRARRVPLVLCSSKTRAEMEPLSRDLGLAGPMIVENGGAFVMPAESGGAVHVLGARHAELVTALAEIAAEAGAKVRGFSSLSALQIARLSGLSTEAAERARRREYDEPFVLDTPGRLPRLVELAERRELRVTHGGRFHHLTGRGDKGLALREWLRLAAHEGRSFATVGLGDAKNDEPLLHAVDRPILVPRPGGAVDPGLAVAFPGAERAPAPGPVGWNAAVLAVLAGERLPQA